LFTGADFNNGDVTGAICASGGWFACAVAVGATISVAVIGGLEITQGGGGHASLPSAPPALLGAQLAQQLARHGFTPQYEVYDWPSPGTHFDQAS